MSAADLGRRVVGAPISWGVCEVPGWGHQLDVDLVLGQMRELGLRATELGPDGFLPGDPTRLRTLLDQLDLRPVAQFVPVVLHVDRHDPIPEIGAAATRLANIGAGVMVLAADSASTGYESTPELTDEQWSLVCRRLDEAERVAAAHGVTLALHPHVGTVIERQEHVDRVLSGSEVGLCLDTGHLMVGGVDPLELARRHGGRVRHVHLKDVVCELASQVQEGVLGYHEAVSTGLYVPLGDGDVPLAELVTALEEQDYRGDYVLEQDVVLAPGDEARPRAEVARSIAHLQRLLLGVGTS